jgi:hypothetical protein
MNFNNKCICNENNENKCNFNELEIELNEDLNELSPPLSTRSAEEVSNDWQRSDGSFDEEMNEYEVKKEIKINSEMCVKSDENVFNEEVIVNEVNPTMSTRSGEELATNSDSSDEVMAEYKELIKRKEQKISNQINVKNNNHLKCFWPKCQFSTEYIQALNLHMNRHKGMKPFECDFNACHKQFTTKCELNEHKSRVHQNIRKYICVYNECKKGFKTNTALIQHKRCVHLNERQYKCEYIGCHKRFHLKIRSN